MNQALGDGVAIAFAIGFYKALGVGFSIEKFSHLINHRYSTVKVTR
ncbi:hypothetical protein FJSC11DRAFT_1259 [Fischerella thermalis JSC-11]|uniref:Uncharacterized protein n=1 Tax=Fischerella thermalis JSC-11 TaxID=741277 RepID=G6FQW2_9CYAN|nr:hypothetical protein [Fischerella thermalis]EHC18197.1 hypothetical protein FJSC11DRAFT_1259 [Fischerella thermalis JSC-11]